MDDIDFYLMDLKSKFNKIDFKKYYLAFSGGRDSYFIYWFIKNILKDNNIQIISVNTRLEHVQIMKRMYKYADKVLIPSKTLTDIKKEVGIPCFTKQQDDYISRYQRGSRAPSTLSFINGRINTKFTLNKKAKNLLLNGNLHKVSNKCCYFLKKKPFKDFEKETSLKPIVCVRSTESIMRNKYKSCFTKSGMFTPIFDLTDELLKKIEERFDIEIPEIYKYLKRTGCMGCPYGRNTAIELSLINDTQRKYIINIFKDSYKVKGVQTINKITSHNTSYKKLEKEE